MGTAATLPRRQCTAWRDSCRNVVLPAGDGITSHLKEACAVADHERPGISGNVVLWPMLEWASRKRLKSGRLGGGGEQIEAGAVMRTTVEMEKKERRPDQPNSAGQGGPAWGEKETCAQA